MSKTLAQIVNLGDQATMDSLIEVDMTNWMIMEHYPIGKTNITGVIYSTGRGNYNELGISWCDKGFNRTIGLSSNSWRFEIIDLKILSFKRIRPNDRDYDIPPEHVSEYTLFDPTDLVQHPSW